jgi:hypothetical protein
MLIGDHAKRVVGKSVEGFKHRARRPEIQRELSNKKDTFTFPELGLLLLDMKSFGVVLLSRCRESYSPPFVVILVVKY